MLRVRNSSHVGYNADQKPNYKQITFLILYWGYVLKYLSTAKYSFFEHCIRTDQCIQYECTIVCRTNVLYHISLVYTTLHEFHDMNMIRFVVATMYFPSVTEFTVTL